MSDRSRRWIKRSLFIFIGVVVVAVILGALAFSPLGERRIQRLVESAMTRPEKGESLSLGSLSLSPGGWFAVGPIALQRGDELKVEVGAAEGKASLFSLLSGKVHLVRLSVRVVAVDSAQPARRAAPAVEDATGQVAASDSRKNANRKPCGSRLPRHRPPLGR
ncbi:hypothetical protein HS125_14820 [bacterium]|nr:hypothetical protein [bacterium]